MCCVKLLATPACCPCGAMEVSPAVHRTRPHQTFTVAVPHSPTTPALHHSKVFSLYCGPGAQGIPTHKISLSNGPRHPSVCLYPTVAERVRAPGEDGEPGVALSLVAAVTAILDKRRGTT